MGATNHHTTVGTLFLVVSALLTAGSNVYYSNQVQQISPFTFTFISFLLTALFFHGIQMQKQSESKKVGTENTKGLIGLNISTAGVFMSFYFALKYIEPAIVGSIEIGVGPVASLLISKIFYRKRVKSVDVFTGIGTLIGCLFLIFATLQGKSGLPFASLSLGIMGLTSAFLCGFFAALAAIYSKNLSEAKWSSTKILAHRFYAIITISLFIALSKGNFFGQLASNWLWIIILSIIGVAIPLFFLQIGIQHSDTFFVMMSLSFIPIFTFVFQFLDPRTHVSSHSLVGIVIIFGFALFSVYMNSLKNSSNKKRKGIAV